MKKTKGHAFIDLDAHYTELMARSIGAGSHADKNIVLIDFFSSLLELVSKGTVLEEQVKDVIERFNPYDEDEE